MANTDKGTLRSDGMRMVVAILYAYALAGAGVYVWFVCQQAIGLLLIWGGVGMSYRFFQIVFMIIYAIIFLATVTVGQHLFEKALVKKNTWLPRSFLIILGGEGLLWLAARLIIRAFGI